MAIFKRLRGNQFLKKYLYAVILERSEESLGGKNSVIFAFPCISNRGRGTAFAVDEVFLRLRNKIKFQLKRWYTSSVPSGQLPLLKGEAIFAIAVHTLLTHSKTVIFLIFALDISVEIW